MLGTLPSLACPLNTYLVDVENVENDVLNPNILRALRSGYIASNSFKLFKGVQTVVPKQDFPVENAVYCEH